MSRAIAGFDYSARRPVSRTLKEWRAQVSQIIAAGGRRRVEGGETFIHGADGRIQAEIYGNIPAPKAVRS